MKLAAFDAGAGVSYGVVQGGKIVDVGAHLKASFPDLHSVISAAAIDQVKKVAGDSPTEYPCSDVRFLKPIAQPGKILCVGVNFPDRSAEYGDASEPPKYPSIFVRFPDSLVAHQEALLRPLESKQFDYEGEIAVVIGRRGRRIPEQEAFEHVLGYTIFNDGTVRDWLRHGKFNVTPGKNFERSGSIGPWIATTEDFGNRPLRIMTRVNGEVRQDDTADHMIFSVPFQLAYISRFCTLEPGDIIVTGTPTGAGARFEPPRYLSPGDIVEVEVSGIGILRNNVVDEPA